MKKLLCLTLAVLMILSLCACGGSSAGGPEEPKEKPQLEVGFGRVNITPSYAVGMSSSGTEKHRRHEGIISYVYATCVAVRYGAETYLMYTVDTISIDENLGDILRVEILNEIPDLKLENIFFGATHTHSAPANRFTDNEAEGKYRQEFIAYMPMVAKQAIKDLAPATVEACKFDIEGMNFVRHYIMNDGTYAGSNFGVTASGYKAEMTNVLPEHQKDQEVILSVRPEEFLLSKDTSVYGITATVDDCVFLGLNTHYFVHLESGEEVEIIQESSIDSIIEPGTKIKLTINTDKVNVFTADTESNILTGVQNDCAN
jgi:hypothetical protein